MCLNDRDLNKIFAIYYCYYVFVCLILHFSLKTLTFTSDFKEWVIVTIHFTIIFHWFTFLSAAKSAKLPKLKVDKSGACNAFPPEMDTSSDSDDSAYTDSNISSEAEFGFADESDPQTVVADSS